MKEATRKRPGISVSSSLSLLAPRPPADAAQHAVARDDRFLVEHDPREAATHCYGIAIAA